MMPASKQIVFWSIISLIALSLGFFIFSTGYFDNEAIKRPVKIFFDQSNIFQKYIEDNNTYLNKIGIEKADDLIHQHMFKTHRNIFTGGILTKYNKNIIHCSFFSEDYQVYFSGLDNLKIEKMEVKRTGLRRATCKVTYRSRESSNLEEYENYSIKNLVNDYKVKNFTQDQLNKAEYSNFILYLRQQDKFSLKRIKNKWYIYKFNYIILDSRLKLIKPIDQPLIHQDVDYDDLGIELISNETIGFLKLDISDKTVIEKLGEPVKKSEASIWGADGLEHQTWNYKGIELDMIRQDQTQIVNSITIEYPCNFRTARNIGIGSTKNEVIARYRAEIDAAENDRNSDQLIVGTVYSGIIFQFTNNKVSKIFIGAESE